MTSEVKQMRGASDNRAAHLSLTLTLSRHRERELEGEEFGKRGSSGMRRGPISLLLDHGFNRREAPHPDLFSFADGKREILLQDKLCVRFCILIQWIGN
jgi:hypothetical protein